MAEEPTTEPRVVIDGNEYPIPQSFTFKEMSLIKRLSGVRAGELQQAMDAGDTDLMAAIAIIAMRRSGAEVDEAKFFDADIGSVTVTGPEEVNGGPPGGAADADK